MRFLPREEKFHALFGQQVEIILQAATLLQEGIQRGNSAMERCASGIAELERRGDDVAHDVFTRLNQTFITPFDPEDIHALAGRLDDVLDGLEEAAHRIFAFHLEPIPNTVCELGAVVAESCRVVKLAVDALNKGESVLEHCIEINRLEEQADHVLRKAVIHLFAEEKDPIQLIRKKEVYEVLEETTDRCEDVADVLKAVVVKNS